MSVLPLNLIKGTRSVAYERLENTEDIEDVEHQIEKLKSKVSLKKKKSQCICWPRVLIFELWEQLLKNKQNWTQNMKNACTSAGVHQMHKHEIFKKDES